MAQHAKPNVMGHMLDSRAQLIACSSVVAMTLSSRNVPSSHPMKNYLQSSSVIPALNVLSFRRSDKSALGFRNRGSFDWTSGGAFGRGAPDPIQIASSPQVREPHQQDAKEHQQIPKCQPAQPSRIVDADL